MSVVPGEGFYSWTSPPPLQQCENPASLGGHGKTLRPRPVSCHLKEKGIVQSDQDVV